PEAARLQALARARGLAERVTFQATIPSVEMPRFYQRMDVLALPSRSQPNWAEQFGRVLVEGMACGVSVVGAETGEIPHVIGEAGLTFPEEDVSALRTLLAHLAADPVLRRELGARGRARVLAHFTQRQIAAETVAVYREMLA
ncbi:MAG: glycosyl transferase family 1, partial [Chloroflexi bacterium]